MSTIKCLSVFVLASLFYNVANAETPDPNKYTVTFRYNDVQDWCLGGIIGDDMVLTSGDCFAYNGDFINYTSLKAVIGSHKLDVDKIILFEFSEDDKRAVHDFALVKLKQKFNLDQNGLIALSLPKGDEVNGAVFASNEENNKAEQVEITDDVDCSLETNDAEINFYDESQLCVKLPNEDDRCYNQAGSPLVDESNKLIGIYLECYDESPLEIFAKVSYFNDLINEALEEDFEEDGKVGSFVVKNY